MSLKRFCREVIMKKILKNTGLYFFHMRMDYSNGFRQLLYSLSAFSFSREWKFLPHSLSLFLNHFLLLSPSKFSASAMPTTLCPLWNLHFYALIFQRLDLWLNIPSSPRSCQLYWWPTHSRFLSVHWFPHSYTLLLSPVLANLLSHPSAHQYLGLTPYSVITTSEIWFHVPPLLIPTSHFPAVLPLQQFSNYTKTSNLLTYFFEHSQLHSVFTFRLTQLGFHSSKLSSFPCLISSSYSPCKLRPWFKPSWLTSLPACEQLKTAEERSHKLAPGFTLN